MATKSKKQKEKPIHTEVIESAHKIWLAGLGAMSVAEEEGGKMFRNLVERGQEFEARGKESLGKLKDSMASAADKAKEAADETAERIGAGFDERVAKALGRIGVPTKEEIAGLSKRVEELTAAVDKLRAQQASTRAEAAKKSTRAASSKAKAEKA